MSANRTRLFVALPVPPFDAFLKLPRNGLAEGRWTAADDLHITLRFLGDVSDDRIPEIEDSLSRVRRPRFGIESRGLGVFEKDRQNILYAKIESIKKMTTLCADITDALTKLGFDFGPRPFYPHVTLARFPVRQLLDDYIARHGQRVQASWRADEFRLMESSGADVKSSRFRMIAEYKLT